MGTIGVQNHQLLDQSHSEHQDLQKLRQWHHLPGSPPMNERSKHHLSGGELSTEAGRDGT